MDLTKGIKTSLVSPTFLHANSTSHTWAFSAIAEIIDNAYDPDVNASELWIDKIEANNKTCLTFTDNGAGMNPDKLIKMLSFGFCEKSIYESRTGHKPIGHYGNGFKSGSMRIADDVLVFTRHLHEQSVGMLSQTFLNRTKAETVVVPLVTWSNKDKSRENNEEIINNIRAITTYSDFKTEDRLLAEFKELEKLQTGTRIILYNLKSDKTGKLELDFESNPTDVLNPQTLAIDTTSVYRPVQEAIARYQISLREYCSILFLKPRMKIFLRGLKVKTKLICKSLSQTETDRYRPTWLDRPLKITYGFTCNKDNVDEYGVMMYHRNRLIKAFEKVGYQKQANDLGVGVVGIVEVNFLQPIHNKQDFNKDEKYNTFMSALSQKTNDYWKVKKMATNRNSERMRSDWLWVQCDNCLKWRRLPDESNRHLPDKWFCYMNPDASHNRCDIEEEPEDEDQSLQYASNKKTFKLEQEKEKRKTKAEEKKKTEGLHRMLEKAKQHGKLLHQKQNQQLEVAAENLYVPHFATNLFLRDTSDMFHPLSTVSSTTEKEKRKTKAKEKKKTEGLKKMLEQAKQHGKLLQQKQNQQLEVAAENLCVSHFATNLFLRDTSDMIHPLSTVSSTTGTKRKGENKSRMSKKLIIRDEDTNEVVAFIPEAEEVTAIDLTCNRRKTVQPDPKLVEKNRDVKPNITELEKTVQAYLDKSNNASNVTTTGNSWSLSSFLSVHMDTEHSSTSKESSPSKKGSSPSKKGSSPSADSSLSSKDGQPSLKGSSSAWGKRSFASKNSAKILTVSKEIQTVDVKFEDEAEKKQLVEEKTQLVEEKTQLVEEKTQLVEEKMQLVEEKTKVEKRLERIQRDIHELLSIIVSGVDLGAVTDVEGIISEMIRVNREAMEENSS